MLGNVFHQAHVRQVLWSMRKRGKASALVVQEPFYSALLVGRSLTSIKEVKGSNLARCIIYVVYKNSLGAVLIFEKKKTKLTKANMN